MSRKSAEVIPLYPRGLHDGSTAQTRVTMPGHGDATARTSEDINPAKRQGRLVTRLYEVFKLARVQGWDGENAEPVSDAAYYNATQLLATLPIDLPDPNILADNDGYIELEWYQNNRSFSMYITDSNLVLFAGYYGKDDRLSGRFVFAGTFPIRVASLAKDIYTSQSQ